MKAVMHLTFYRHKKFLGGTDYRWRLVHRSNGEILAGTSQGYARFEDMEHNANLVTNYRTREDIAQYDDTGWSGK